MGYRKLFYALPVLAALSLGAAGCGSTHASSSTSGSASASGSASTTSLTVRYVSAPGAQPQTWTLTCDPTGGDHPDAAKSCALLAAAASSGKNPFAPTPHGVMCSMIYAGSQTSTVTGTWLGKPVNASFSRKNGCETSRWNLASPLVGPLVAGGAMGS